MWNVYKVYPNIFFCEAGDLLHDIQWKATIKSPIVRGRQVYQGGKCLLSHTPIHPHIYNLHFSEPLLNFPSSPLPLLHRNQLSPYQTINLIYFVLGPIICHFAWLKVISFLYVVYRLLTGMVGKCSPGQNVRFKKNVKSSMW